MEPEADTDELLFFYSDADFAESTSGTRIAKKMLWQCAPAEAIGARDEVLALRKQQAKDSHVDACVCMRRFASVCECMARTDCSNPSLEYILPAPAPGPEVLHSLRPCVVLN